MSVIPKGSLVLVTGANGFIASHIVDQLIQAGFKVRGTTRTEEKGEWLKTYFGKQYGSDKFELATVPNMAVKGAFDEAVKGTSSVVHVASNLSFSKNPNDVIPEVIAGITHTLEAAATEPAVKRFVYTSSSTAATSPIPNKRFVIKKDTWNTECVDRAWAPPPYEAERSWDVYGASKTQAEQALWKFVEERKPSFEVNAVLPNANFGPILSPDNQPSPSTGAWVPQLYLKGTGEMKDIPPQWMVDVRDTARLHVAAIMDADVKSERVFAFAEAYNWNKLLGILRELNLKGKIADDIEGEAEDLSTVEQRDRAEEILHKNFGVNGFTTLRESVEANLAHVIQNKGQ